MMKLLLPCLLFLALPALAQEQETGIQQPAITAGNLAALDSRNGFRQYQLGSPIANYSTLKPRGKDLYAAPAESMTIGDAKLSMLLFMADKGRLSGIVLTAYDAVNCSRLLDALTAQYGQPQKVAYNQFAWQGQAVTMLYETKTSIAASGSPYIAARERQSCTVYITSNAIAAEHEAARKEAAKKAANDL